MSGRQVLVGQFADRQYGATGRQPQCRPVCRNRFENASFVRFSPDYPTSRLVTRLDVLQCSNVFMF